jgi:hypothetical protein
MWSGPRRGALILAFAGAFVATTAACRADGEDCEAVATHVTELAAAEDKAGAGMKLAIAEDCKQMEPTKQLVECMLAAESLAEVEAC